MTTPGISLTLFKNVFDNKTNKRIDLNDFKAFERFLFNLSKKSLQGKKDAHLISQQYIKKTLLGQMIMLLHGQGGVL